MYFDLRLPAESDATVPVPATHNAFMYVYEGDAVVGDDDRPLPFRAAGLLASGDAVRIRAGGQGVKLLLLAGRPIGEPVVQYGPFVMNTSREIEQAIIDYQRGTLAAAS
jgi:redox-sensitive bicupin YhaK (pirin superfamily)